MVTEDGVVVLATPEEVAAHLPAIRSFFTELGTSDTEGSTPELEAALLDRTALERARNIFEQEPEALATYPLSVRYSSGRMIAVTMVGLDGLDGQPQRKPYGAGWAADISLTRPGYEALGYGEVWALSSYFNTAVPVDFPPARKLR